MISIEDFHEIFFGLAEIAQAQGDDVREVLGAVYALFQPTTTLEDTDVTERLADYDTGVEDGYRFVVRLVMAEPFDPGKWNDLTDDGKALMMASVMIYRPDGERITIGEASALSWLDAVRPVVNSFVKEMVDPEHQHKILSLVDGEMEAVENSVAIMSQQAIDRHVASFRDDIDKVMNGGDDSG